MFYTNITVSFNFISIPINLVLHENWYCMKKKKTKNKKKTEMLNLPIAFSVHITLYYYIAAKYNRYFFVSKP